MAMERDQATNVSYAYTITVDVLGIQKGMLRACGNVGCFFPRDV